MPRRLSHARDKEVREQEHELHCWIHDVSFKQRTEFTCNCAAKERYKKEFIERRSK